jgi:uncharacterized membrane protein
MITIKNILTMEVRPKIKLELSTTDKAFEVIGWLLIFSVWGLIITNYAILPDTIPAHYNGAGEVDEFGGKETILTLPITATVLLS